MPQVRIAQQRVWVGEESRPLLHGEVHYWRLSPSRRRDVLQAVRWHRSHPEFRREATRYLTAVVEAFAPLQATRGGPVVLVQPDNEPDPWADVYGAQLGLGTEPGLFQELLGPDAQPVQAALGPDQATAYLDVVRFAHSYSEEIVEW